MNGRFFATVVTMSAMLVLSRTAPVHAQFMGGVTIGNGFSGGSSLSYDLRLSFKHNSLRGSVNLRGNSYDYDSDGYSSHRYSSRVSSAEAAEPVAGKQETYGRNWQPVTSGAAERGAQPAGDDISVEPLSGNRVRVTRRMGGVSVREIKLFLADAQQKALATQTLTAAPFTATFEVAPGTTYVGLSVVWSDGASSTSFIRYNGSGGNG